MQRRRIVVVAIAFLLAVSAAVLILGGRESSPPRALAYGLSGEQPAAFVDPRFRALKLTRARVQISWDLFTHRDLERFPGIADEQRRFGQWLAAARAAGISNVLLAFKASRDQPGRLPTRREYEAGVLKVLASVDAKGDGQMIDSISAWNEPDLVPATAARPFEAGQLFSVIRRICRERGCTALAGDFADSRFTAAYLSKYLDGAGAPMPLHWAWHAYDDAWTRRVDPSMPRLRRFLSLLPANAQVRLSEQGGILWRPRSRVSGERRISQTPAQAGADLSFLLSKAATIDPRVNAFDVYQWRGEPPPAWDSGLIAPDGATRPSYCVFAKALAVAAPACL